METRKYVGRLTGIMIMVIIIMCSFTYGVHAQWSLNVNTHLPQNKDRYIKSVVEFVEPGMGGRGIVWDYGDIDGLNKDVSVLYRVVGDSLVLKFEGDKQSMYYVKNDSVSLLRYENTMARMRSDLSCVYTNVPLNYGSRHESPYIFSGVYCDRYLMKACGKIITKSDGEGTLIIPGDTIADVIRIHQRILADVYVGNSTKELSIDTLREAKLINCKDSYMWYSRWYRYPILETHINTYSINGEIIYSEEGSFLCHPKMQEYDLTVEEVQIIHGAEDSEGEEENDKKNKKGVLSDVSVDLNDDSITFSYSVADGIAEVEATLFDLYGRVYGRIEKTAVNPGFGSLTMDCSHVLPGNYLFNVKHNEVSTTRYIRIK